MRKRSTGIKKSFVNNRLLLIYGAVFILLLLVVNIFISTNKSSQKQKSPPDPNIQIKKDTLKIDEKLIAFTEDGFTPANMTIPGENKRALVFYNATTKPQTLSSSYINFPTTVIQPQKEFSYRFDVIGLWTFTLKDLQNKKMVLIVQ